jgi:hypothetical protein
VRKLGTRILVTLLAVAGGGVAATPAAAATASGPIVGLAGKCVDVAGAGTADGTAVQLYACNGTAAQTWTTGAADDTVRALGKCMDVTSAGTADGTTVQLWTCNGTAAQQWTYQDGELVNTGSGKCLDVTDHGTADGTRLQIWSCTGGSNQTWTLPTGGTPPQLNPNLPPGGNFDLSVWELQLPTGSPGSPTTISPAQLKGPNGYTNPAYFFTDKTDGSMTFWDPESGVTTPNSSYPRSELREMNPDGSAADWPLAGNHTLSATLRITQVTKNVCVGQVHLGTGGSSTKPLLELYYKPDGTISAGLENSPDGGQTLHTVGTVALGVPWSYVINVSGNTLRLTVNGSTTSYAIPSSFNAYHEYFKAGDYNQSASSSTTNGAKVKFYSLTVAHS